MVAFQDFSSSDWKLFCGNFLMFATCVFYVVWWTVAFWPNGRGNAKLATIFITATILLGLGAIVVLFLGIGIGSEGARTKSIIYILVGAVVAYPALLALTKVAFQRPVTSELLIMIIWGAVELAAVASLNADGRFGAPLTALLSVLVGLATCVGLVCYILYYRLDGMASFWDGLIPLATDGVVVAILLAAQAFAGK